MDLHGGIGFGLTDVCDTIAPEFLTGSTCYSGPQIEDQREGNNRSD